MRVLTEENGGRRNLQGKRASYSSLQRWQSSTTSTPPSSRRRCPSWKGRALRPRSGGRGSPYPRHQPSAEPSPSLRPRNPRTKGIKAAQVERKRRRASSGARPMEPTTVMWGARPMEPPNSDRRGDMRRLS
ncbi:unnamed protein product, partial [Musa textilis]